MSNTSVDCKIFSFLKYNVSFHLLGILDSPFGTNLQWWKLLFISPSEIDYWIFAIIVYFENYTSQKTKEIKGLILKLKEDQKFIVKEVLNMNGGEEGAIHIYLTFMSAIK